LRKVMDQYSDVSETLEVMLDVDEGGRAFHMARAATERCEPPCSGGRRCVFNARRRRWMCWPPS
jgi:hypothetical protein